MPVPATKVVQVDAGDPWPRWWTVFGEPRLDALVAEARARNPGLVAALARVRAARALARKTGADRLPSVDGTGSYTYQRRGSGTSRIGSSSANQAFSLWSGSVDASWEWDLFGKLRSAQQAAQLDACALEEDRRAADVSLVSEVARAWYDLRTARAREEILRDDVRLLEATRALVAARVETKIANELDLRRVEGEEAAARARIPLARLAAEVAEHRLATLLGQPPDRHFETSDEPLFAPPPVVPVGLPAALVRRRPDVRAAERRVAAAHARVAEAIADFYPSITLDGGSGLASLDLGRIFSGNAVSFSFGPSVSIPIFDGGQRAAERLVRLAEQDESVAQFTTVLLTALGEVADAVAGLDARLEARAELQKAVEAQRRAVELARAQYEAQLVNYLPVIDSLTALERAREDLLDAERAVREEVIRLGKALGGGWNPAP
jgi:NodT family efflux transporter outer membrane factor (OMF) lipoprotein